MNSGIHGLPNADWDGVKNPRSTRKGGYCAHGRPVFPIWHRPYLAMYEVCYGRYSHVDVPLLMVISKHCT